jgi:hypothetical protein
MQFPSRPNSFQSPFPDRTRSCVNVRPAPVRPCFHWRSPVWDMTPDLFRAVFRRVATSRTGTKGTSSWHALQTQPLPNPKRPPSRHGTSPTRARQLLDQSRSRMASSRRQRAFASSLRHPDERPDRPSPTAPQTVITNRGASTAPRITPYGSRLDRKNGARQIAKIDIRRPKCHSKSSKWLHAQDSFAAKNAVGNVAGNSVFQYKKNPVTTYSYSRNSNPVSPTIISAKQAHLLFRQALKLPR